MLRINGEITSFLTEFDYESKEELMEKLRALRKAPNLSPTCDYEIFYNLIGTAIQEAYYTNANQLMRFKNYCNFKRQKEARDEKTAN